MPRPCCCRRIAGQPACILFKPAGIPAASLQEIALTLDELEAMRLADLEGLYQEQAAEKMKVSRPTFGRIVESARRKVTEALVKGFLLRIEGGVVMIDTVRTFKCHDCQHKWQLPHGTGRPTECPACKSRNIHRDAAERGPKGHVCGRQAHGWRGGRA